MGGGGGEFRTDEIVQTPGRIRLRPGELAKEVNSSEVHILSASEEISLMARMVIKFALRKDMSNEIEVYLIAEFINLFEESGDIGFRCGISEVGSDHRG